MPHKPSISRAAGGGEGGQFELDIVLDKVGGEYPAWVTETFLSEQDSLSPSSASLGNGYCWFVSKQQLFVWKYLDKAKRRQTLGSRRFAKMALPPTGLLYSARCVVVYKNGPNAGALAVSGEGVAHHWPNVSNPKHIQCDLELSSQVVLSVQLLEAPIGEKPPTFLLTTTSGSIFYLRPTDNERSGAAMEISKIAGRETKSMRRRLSNMIFGSVADEQSSPAIRSSLIELTVSDEGMEWSRRFSVVVASKLLTIFDIEKRQLLWSLHTEQFFTETIGDAIKAFTSEPSITGIRCWLLDAIEFRDSLLCLIAATCNQRNGTVLFLLATLDGLETEPDEVAWCSVVPYPSETVRYVDEDEFCGKVSLLVPSSTAKAAKNADGVLILHPGFANVVYVPENVTFQLAPIRFSKSDFFMPTDRLIGCATDDQYNYVMLTSTGIATVRLLPRGFEDALLDEDSSAALLAEIIPNGNEQMQRLTAAFTQFGEKDIAEAQNTISSLLQMTDSELGHLVYSFLEHILNYFDDGEHHLELVLKVKRLCVQRFILFLQQFGLFERISRVQVHVGRSPKPRSLASLLAEASELIAVGISLLDWMRLSTDNTDAVKMALEKMQNKKSTYPSPVVVKDIEQEAIGHISSLALLPMGLLLSVKEIFKKSAYNMSQKLEVLHIAVEMLLKYSASIETNRRCSASVATVQGEVLWTHDGISEAFAEICRIILELLVQPGGKAEAGRLRECVLRLIVFHLNETTERPDGHEILIGLYNAGDHKAALELAQKFKDFKILIKDTLKLPEKERAETLEYYKKRYAEDDFEIYYCNYLRKHGLNELLLAETGERVDRYLASCEDIRWRRELQNNEYEKACHSLLSLAEKEKADVWKSKVFSSLSKLAALCADRPVTAIVDEAERRLNLINHQAKIPGTLIRKVFADNPNRPLTISEMLQVNLMAGELEESSEELLEGHLRALELVASLLSHPHSEETVLDMACDVWTSAWRNTEWKEIKTKHDEANSLFGLIIAGLVADEDISPCHKLFLLPKLERLAHSVQHKEGSRKSSVIGEKKKLDGEDIIRRLSELARMKLEDRNAVGGGGDMEEQEEMDE